MNKKEWLDKLFYDVGKQRYDFFISGLKRTTKGDISTKWYRYSEKVMIINPWEDYKIKWVNQRQVLPVEIVIDLEEREILSKVVKLLDKHNETYYIYDTGSRGYHIHIFFKKELTEQQKRLFIKKYFGDLELARIKHMVNLEFAKHWKSGKIKKLVDKNGY